MKKKILLYGLAIIGGAIFPLAFAPFGYYWVAEVSLLLLLVTWWNVTPKEAFCYGWVFGLVGFGLGVYWLFYSIYLYGHAPWLFAVCIVILFAAYLALYPACCGYLLNCFYTKNNWQKFLVAFSALFVLLEWVRGWLLSGFPWLFLGYGHIDAWLGGFASVFGVYGVSFLVAHTAGTVFYMVLQRHNLRLIIRLGLWLGMVWCLGFCFLQASFTQQIYKPIPITLVQGNIAQERKWQPGELWNILHSYTTLTADNFSSKIIVWPEAAIPTYPEEIKPYLQLLEDTAKIYGATIISGIPLQDIEQQRSYNGIIALGASKGKYYKRRLVPFGEYLPCKFILKWLHNLVDIPMSDFASGTKEQKGIFVDGILLAPFICYEIAYPYLVLDYLPQVGALVTVCDDSWFGESIAIAQHLEIARMRSLEVARYQLLATSTGITAVINPQGKIVASAEPFKEAVVCADIYNTTGTTLWVLGGKYLWLVLVLVGLVFAAWRNIFPAKRLRN